MYADAYYWKVFLQVTIDQLFDVDGYSIEILTLIVFLLSQIRHQQWPICQSKACTME